MSDPTATTGKMLGVDSDIRSTEDIPKPSAPRCCDFGVPTLVGFHRMASVSGPGPRSVMITLLLRVAVMA